MNNKMHSRLPRRGIATVIPNRAEVHNAHR